MGFKPPERRLPLAFIMAVAGSFLFSGCGDGDLKAEYGEDEVVSFGITARIRGLDPAVSGEVSASMAISRMYEGLLKYDYLARPYKAIPMLAEGMPHISDDGLVYTFKIRNGIYFQDDPCFPGGKGRELVAGDFVYSYKRLADIKNASSGFWAFNRIKGIHEFRDASAGDTPTDYDAGVAGLRAPDRYTFQIELSEPFPQFLDVLTMHYAFVVPREAVEYHGTDFVNHPVGTGPYRLVKWRRNSRIEFERNPKWAETGRTETYPVTGSADQKERGLLRDAGKPVPMVDRVVQFVVDDQSTAWMMFLSGQLDASGISRDNWDAVITGDRELDETLAKRGIELVYSPAIDIRYLGFNMDDPVVGWSRDPETNLRHKKLRQALSCAYDFDRMNKFLNYRLYPANGPIPKPLAGRPEGPTAYMFNLEKAKQLLVEAGYPGGINRETGRRLELTVEVGSASGNIRQMMELIADMYQKIDVVFNFSYNTWPAFIEKLNRRQAQMFGLAWMADYPDAENFLQLFYSKNESPGPNHSNYRSPEFDRLYEEIRIMQDSPERTAKYEQMARIVIEDCPWIFEYQSMSFALVHGWLENFEPHDFPYGMGIYRNMNLEKRRQWMKEFGDKKLDM
jgi:oligopeptide transport system substrate-binding protein